MSNEQKDWEADLQHESREELIDSVKYFQSVALDNYAKLGYIQRLLSDFFEILDDGSEIMINMAWDVPNDNAKMCDIVEKLKEMI